MTLGQRFPREYRIWIAMRARCRDPKRRGYQNYGGRGICVCKRWDSFANFLADMGPCPPTYSIDRKNNDGNYSPRNCRWASIAEQKANTRATLTLTYKGVTKPIFVWAAELGVEYSALRSRFKWGWSAEEIIERPVLRVKLDSKENRQRRRVYYYLSQALKRGELIRPAVCSVEGCRNTDPHAYHHRGHDKGHELDVVWLCLAHWRAAKSCGSGRDTRPRGVRTA